MTKIHFTKPPTTYEEQVVLLQKRGMIITDVKDAYFYLQHVNYYRLRAYWLPFEENKETHDFKSGTCFETVVTLYNFDRELRLLITESLERIEISMRTQWTYHMAHNHGVHSHLNKNLAVNEKRYQQNFKSMKKEVERADEVFIRHSIDRYKEPLPAIWAMSEIISLGILSKLYSNLKPMPTRCSIAKTYNLNEKILGSWLHHLTNIRNICAHHARLWNRDFTTIPMQPKHKPSKLVGEFVQKSRKLYNTLVILLHCMDVIAPGHSWRQKIKTLLNNPSIPLVAMDFPADWQTHAIWSDLSSGSS
jgi:abortive infection bacteriophage resistance protein